MPLIYAIYRCIPFHTVRSSAGGGSVRRAVPGGMTHDERLTWISEWMRFWAPEVKKRLERGEQLFADCKEAYESVRAKPFLVPTAEACAKKMAECRVELDKAPPGAYDYLAHIGTFIP